MDELETQIRKDMEVEGKIFSIVAVLFLFVFVFALGVMVGMD